MIESSDTSSSYDVWHAALEVDEEAATPWHQLIRDFMNQERDLAGRRVLEIGCGRGGFSCWMARTSPPPAEVVAMDFSPVAVDKGQEYAARTGITNVQWRTGDIQNIAYPDASFDTVVSCETIEHVPDPARAVAELARVLKPGGRLFLTTPNYLGPLGLYRGYLRLRGQRYTEVGQPINRFTMLPRTLHWIRRAGLQRQVVSGKGHYFLYPGRSPRPIPWLDIAPLKWFALHVLVTAVKLG